MSLSPCMRELKSAWLPHITDQGLDRVIDLLEKGSPLLIHGAFTRALPMGCLATHIGWHHPATKRFTLEAGIQWLSKIAHLNPATSEVIRSWDTRGPRDWQLRSDLLESFKEERERRQTAEPIEDEIGELVLA